MREHKITINVGELKAFLEFLKDDTPVYLKKCGDDVYSVLLDNLELSAVTVKTERSSETYKGLFIEID